MYRWGDDEWLYGKMQRNRHNLILIQILEGSVLIDGTEQKTLH